jgi:hypothetical protein
MELRGYEVARLTRGSWVPVSKWRPSELGLNGALDAARWLNERHPGETYTVRPVVSMLPPRPAPKDELHLEADEDPGPPGDPEDEDTVTFARDPALNKFRQTADEVPE